MFILDTDHIGILQQESEAEFSKLMARLAEHPATSFYFTIISFHEQFLGWNAYIGKAKKIEGVVKGYDKLQQIVTDFNAAQVLPFDHAAAKEFLTLRKQNVRIGTMDLRIAAIASAHSMIVLTRNVRDFEKVPGLEVEDWTL